MRINKYWLVLAALILITPQAYAANENTTDSVTGTVGVGYNGASISNGVLLVDGVNDYVDTTIAVNYSTSFTVTAWARKNTSVNCMDGGNIVGRAYDWRIFTGAACEIIANFQNITASDRTHYNASLSFTNNTWRHLVWTYNSGNNRSEFYVDGILRSNISQQSVEQLDTTKTWRIGGNPTTGLYFNGSIANVTIYNQTFDQANVTYLYNNNTPYCTNLVNWWAFNSTVPTCYNATVPTHNIYVNITIGTTIRATQTNTRGAHTAETLQNPAYSNSVLRNHTNDLLVVETTKIGVYRKDYDLANFCPTFSGNTSTPCTFTTTYGSNYNITAVKNMVAEAASRAIKVHFVDDGPTRWGADNSSKCTYGSNAPDFNYTSCDWANNTIHANAINQFLDAVDCDLYPGTCVHEARNEPYLASGTILGAAAGTFYYRNNTVTCAERVTGQMIEWNQTTPLIRARWNTTIEYWSAAFNVGYHPCGQVMAEQFMLEHPRGGNNSPDYMNDHEYSSGNPPDLNVDLALAEAVYAGGGYSGYWGLTESGLNNNALNYGSQDYQAAALMSYYIYFLKSTTAQRMLFFQFDGDESYIIYNGTTNTIRYPGKVLNATKWSDETAGSVIDCYTTNVNVTCAHVQINNTKGVFLLSNRNNLTVLVQNVSINGSNITAGVDNGNGTSITALEGDLVNISLQAYSINGYNLTVQGADVIAPTITNRTEWSNQTQLQINLTFSEAANASVNYGLNFTTLGNKSNQSDFNTYHSFNLSPLLSNTNYHYNITACDATGNCATYGIYSEYTTNYSISYTTTTPATPVSIAEPNNQAFTVAVSNPSNHTLTYEWLLNGTNQTTYYNSSTYTFIGSYTSEGIYNVTNKVYSASNTLNYSWSLTVTDTTQSSSSTCTEAADSFGALAGWMMILVTILMGTVVLFAVKGIINLEWMIIGLVGILLLAFVMFFSIAVLTGASSLC